MTDLLKKNADPNIFGEKYGSDLNTTIVPDNPEAVIL
jgi:hypothetical protein